MKKLVFTWIRIRDQDPDCIKYPESGSVKNYAYCTGAKRCKQFRHKLCDLLTESNEVVAFFYFLTNSYNFLPDLKKTNPDLDFCNADPDPGRKHICSKSIKNGVNGITKIGIVEAPPSTLFRGLGTLSIC